MFVAVEIVSVPDLWDGSKQEFNGLRFGVGIALGVSFQLGFVEQSIAETGFDGLGWICSPLARSWSLYIIRSFALHSELPA